MKLLTTAIRKALPKLYTTEETPTESKVCHLKLFFPAGRFTFYCVEGEQDGDDFRMFGYTKSALGADCDEWGYASLNELQSIRGPLGLKIERDLSWRPTLMGEVLTGRKS